MNFSGPRRVSQDKTWSMVQMMVVLLWLAGYAPAAEVAFIESFDQTGKRIELEPNGQFSHVAIRVGDYWFHAHPYRGVELTPSLANYGHRIRRLVAPSVPEPDLIQVHHWLGKGFDHSYSWSRADSTYCSRLVANLLGIAPLPMSFAAERWQIVEQKPIGEPGLSPDDLFLILSSQGFVEDQQDCGSFLAADGGVSRDGKTAPVYQ